MLIAVHEFDVRNISCVCLQSGQKNRRSPTEFNFRISGLKIAQILFEVVAWIFIITV